MWDHWLLDSIATWDRQPETSYAIPSMDTGSTPSVTGQQDKNPAIISSCIDGLQRDIMRTVYKSAEGVVSLDTCGELSTRKRMREQQQLSSLKESLSTAARLSVAQYFKEKLPTAAKPNEISTSAIDRRAGETL